MFEAWNADVWADAVGLMSWMSRPAWHSTVWQTYEYDYDVNGGYYGAPLPAHTCMDRRPGDLAGHHGQSHARNAEQLRSRPRRTTRTAAGSGAPREGWRHCSPM